MFNEFGQTWHGVGNCSLGCQWAKAHLGQIGLEIRETMNLSYLEYGAFGPNHKCLEKSLRIVLLA